MDLIASFTVNHLLLEPGVYVSRQDADPSTGAVITTFDLRLTAPQPRARHGHRGRPRPGAPGRHLPA